MSNLNKGFVISSSEGELGRALYVLQSRIDEVERMNSQTFTAGVVRVSFVLPAVGIQTY
tara:strand:- start:1147 stop:1323 length:177 start_codon:yes stop_codon:yes gene_type:complete